MLRRHSQNHRETDLQEVIDVEKTVSPQIDLVLPKLVPVNDWPDLRCSVAGTLAAATAEASDRTPKGEQRRSDERREVVRKDIAVDRIEVVCGCEGAILRIALAVDLLRDVCKRSQDSRRARR